MLKCEYRRIKRQAQESIWNKLRVYLNGEDVIAITKSQLDRLMKAYEANKGMTINMSRRQLAYNMKIEGGVSPMRVGLIPFLTGTFLPALWAGALSRLARTSVQKLIGN